MFGKDTLRELLKEISTVQEIQVQDIPEIDLYMDQVTTFMDNKLGSLKRDKKDKILTKTMINNYSKAGILMPSKKKRYSREHMILLIIIYKLKQIISINDIELLFAPLLEKGQNKSDKTLIGEIYSIYLEIENDKSFSGEDIFAYQLKSIEEYTKEFDTEDREDLEWFLLVMLLVNEANNHKRLAERIIDKYFKKA
jgi:hypothetical protein